MRMGLDDDDHYTTAHDMAIIFDAALNDVFRYVDSTAPTRFRQQTSMVREIVPDKSAD